MSVHSDAKKTSSMFGKVLWAAKRLAMPAVVLGIEQLTHAAGGGHAGGASLIAMLFGLEMFKTVHSIETSLEVRKMVKREDAETSERERLFNHDLARAVAVSIRTILQGVAADSRLPQAERDALEAAAEASERVWLSLADQENDRGEDSAFAALLEGRVRESVTLNRDATDFPPWGEPEMWQRVIRSLTDAAGVTEMFPNDCATLARCVEECRTDFSRQFYNDLKHDLANKGAAFAAVHLRMLGEVVTGVRELSGQQKDIAAKQDQILEALSAKGVEVVEASVDRPDFASIRKLATWLGKLDKRLSAIDDRLKSIDASLLAVRKSMHSAQKSARKDALDIKLKIMREGLGARRWMLIISSAVGLLMLGSVLAAYKFMQRGEERRLTVVLAQLDALIEQQRRAPSVQSPPGETAPISFSDEAKKAALSAAELSSGLARAKAAIIEGDFQKARKELELERDQSKHAYEYFMTMGDTYYFEYDNDEAAYWYGKALDTPNGDRDVSARIALAQALVASSGDDLAKRIDDAIRLNEGTLLLLDAGSAKWGAVQLDQAWAWASKPNGDLDENKSMALIACARALQVFSRRDHPRDWAVGQTFLAMILTRVDSADDKPDFDEAIKALNAALEVFTLQEYPKDWARTQIDLGITWANHIEKGEERFGKAMEAFEAALRVNSRDVYPSGWATLQHNIGCTYLNRSSGDRATNVKLAIEHFESALEVRQARRMPFEFAKTQLQLGRAWSEKRDGDVDSNLDSAERALAAALTVFTKEGFPEEWANAMRFLGETLLRRPQRNDHKNFYDGSEYLANSLQVKSFDRFPLLYADTYLSIGEDWMRYTGGNEAANLKYAIYCFDEALRFYTPEQSPQTNKQIRECIVWCNKRLEALK